jgi:hypothetical protein
MVAEIWPKRSPAQQPEPSERRDVVRHVPVRVLPCHVTAIIHEGQQPAEVRDISTDGIGLLTGHPFEAGTILGVHLANAFGTYSRFIMVQVMHRLEQADGRHLLGGEFVGRLGEEELRMLLSGQSRLRAPAPPAPGAAPVKV